MSISFEHTSATTREFPLEFLKKITDNFSEEHIIGRGGYGVVYKGVLETGEEIALKKLYCEPGLDDTQFRNEFNNLMRAQHPNITPLVGYCYNIGHERIKLNNEYVFAHSEQRVLCFEYLQGGSLDRHISDESCGLDWHTRFKIIKGVCEGLNYLHNECKDPIYQLDLKPENILLDKNMVPKIGDFGLSRLFPSAQTYITMKIIGTRGYMPPEYIDRFEITSKFDVFSLGVIIVKIMSGEQGYSKYASMSKEEFLDHVHENWGKRLDETMPSRISEQVLACIEIALRCVEVKRDDRPTIAEILNELNTVDTTQNSPSGQVANFGSKHALNHTPNSECRGTIVFSATYRPPVPFDIFSCPFSPLSTDDELNLTDGVSYNYNGRPIPSAALKTLLKNPKLAGEFSAADADVDAGHVSGLIFVSERDDGLETLYIALSFNADNKVKVFAFADIFGAANFSGARLEDSGCIGGGFSVRSHTIDHSLIYISTKMPPQKSQSPWTVMYKTNLTTGYTERLTPIGMFDLSPSVSPSGKMVAAASFCRNNWNGEIENLKTDIIVMNVDRRAQGGLRRRLLIQNGGWPSWGSDNIIFFHRGTDKTLPSGMIKIAWAVFQYNINSSNTVQVTPEELDAVTPAAISETKVAVATIRQKSEFRDVRAEAQYRHIEIFDMSAPGLPPLMVTQKIRPKSDHYNPFVLDGGARIGYHRCRSDLLQLGDHVPRNLHKLESQESDVSLFRMSGMFPTISKDGSKLAFVDNEFKVVWVADSQGLRIVHEEKGPNSVFSPVWNQNPYKDTLYICVGPSFCASKPMEIYSIRNASSPTRSLKVRRITYGGFNNAFPSSSPEGNKLVFRSTRGGGVDKYKNLYIMLDTHSSENGEGWVMRLTKGRWTDTHCQWSPNGDWIVFSSTRRWGADELDDPGYFSVYLVKATDPTVVIRVIDSGCSHINHPVFSPDGKSIAVTADFAAVSVDPISLPKFMHAVRPCSDIFVVNIVDPCTNDPYEDSEDELMQNTDVNCFRRITHSRYECGTPAWARTFAAVVPSAPWNMLMDMKHPYRLACPVVHPDEGEIWPMTLAADRSC